MSTKYYYGKDWKSNNCKNKNIINNKLKMSLINVRFINMWYLKQLKGQEAKP